MNTTAPPSNSGDSRLQMRPALKLAVGQLPPPEQSLVQITMRVLMPHLKVPCDVIAQPHGDITVQPAGEDVLELSTHYAQRRVDRPVRLSPLSDALSELIEDLLQHEQAAAAGMPHAQATTQTDAAALADIRDATRRAATDDGAPLLDLLLLREEAGPLHVTLRNGLELFVDQRYHTAWSGQSIESLAAAMGDGIIADRQPMSAAELQQRIVKDAPSQTVLVEQLCWMLPRSASSAQLLARWHQPDNAELILETWPNLSSQADMLAWLPLLTAASRAPLPMREALRIAERTGIPADRARDGISLLLMFKHAAVRPREAAAESVFIAPTSTAETVTVAAPSSGLLSRLRSRLRNLMN